MNEDEDEDKEGQNTKNEKRRMSMRRRRGKNSKLTDKVLEMKVHDDHAGSRVAWLIDGMLNIRVEHVEHFILGGSKPNAVLMRLDGADALAAAQAGAHCEVLKARDALVLDADELLLYYKVLFLLCSLLALPNTLSQFGQLLIHCSQVFPSH